MFTRRVVGWGWREIMRQRRTGSSPATVCSYFFFFFGRNARRGNSILDWVCDVHLVGTLDWYAQLRLKVIANQFKTILNSRIDTCKHHCFDGSNTAYISMAPSQWWDMLMWAFLLEFGNQFPFFIVLYFLFIHAWCSSLSPIPSCYCVPCLRNYFKGYERKFDVYVKGISTHKHAHTQDVFLGCSVVSPPALFNMFCLRCESGCRSYSRMQEKLWARRVDNDDQWEWDDFMQCLGLACQSLSSRGVMATLA